MVPVLPAHALGVTDSTMMNVRTSTVGLTTAAAIAAVTVLMPGAVLAGSYLEHFSKAEAEVLPRAATVSVNRSFASSPTQIKYCLIEEHRADSTELDSTRSRDLSKKGLRCPIRILAGDVWTFNEHARAKL
jgi:hypothetical protein